MGSRLITFFAAAVWFAAFGSGGALAQSSAAAGDDNTAGLLAVGDYPAAMVLLRQRADNGDTQAQMTLADLYLGGIGTTRNIHLAVAWLEQAAASGNVHAMIRLGTIYKDMGPAISNGRMQELWPVATGWFIMAAEAGSAEGAYQAGALFETGQVSEFTELLSEEAEEMLALRLLEQAAAMGDSRANFRLAVTDRDAPDFVDRLRVAADSLDGISAQALLAHSSWLEDRMSAQERYFWGLVTLHNVALTGNERMLFTGTSEDLAAEMEELAATLDPADRSETEAQMADFVAGWIDPYP